MKALIWKKTEWLIRNLCCSNYKILWIFLKLSVSTPWRSKMMGRNSDHNYFEPSHSAKRRLPLKSKPNRQLPQTCYWSQANKSASFRELILSYQILDLDYLYTWKSHLRTIRTKGNYFKKSLNLNFLTKNNNFSLLYQKYKVGP